MSDYGEEIIARMGENSNIAKTNNPMNLLINYTVGEWLQNVDDNGYIEQLFLQEATGNYLDVHGQNYGVKRRIDETDEDYRQRIIYEVLGHLTIDFLIAVYNVELYSYIPNFNPYENTLTSDNPYLSVNGFMGVADENTRNILNKKFVLENAIEWLIL